MDGRSDLLPTGHATITTGAPVRIVGSHGARTVKFAFIPGYGFAPSPVWPDADNRFFGNAGIVPLPP